MPNEPLYNVVLHNDDVTPMEFVVQVLQRFIGLDYEGAIKLMLRIHHEEGEPRRLYAGAGRSDDRRHSGVCPRAQSSARLHSRRGALAFRLMRTVLRPHSCIRALAS